MSQGMIYKEASASPLSKPRSITNVALKMFVTTLESVRPVQKSQRPDPISTSQKRVQLCQPGQANTWGVRGGKEGWMEARRGHFGAKEVD